MKVIVSGGAGFIGSHLVDALIDRGIEVYIIDNLVSGQKENVNPQAQLYIVDICSEEASKIIMNIRPDAFYHLAAQADVGKSVQYPKYDGDVNIIGTLNMLEACRKANVGKFIFASTSAVYGNLNNELLSEDEITVPASFYGLSKLTAESYIRLFYELYRQSYTILRYANVYGPRQLPKGEGGVVSVFFDRLRKGGHINVHGDGKQTRDFIYVKDIVTANIAALENGDQETIQVSTSQRTSINEILSYLTDIHGISILREFTAPREGDIKHSCLCNKKATNLLSWKPLYTIEDGLKETYEFHQHDMTSAYLESEQMG
ncbi:NAD-dependent epimerase/dehydratase family protein [Psychrobacillus psychrodurans]|uniref:NAD-dependent epimerase/dehydratase family protein n=1 Tax=Psychrobacillus TaxID=1221880 RepID=UPI0008E6A2E4|nr:NAD-dependent epimerase/dehydratase family protein [Psychrobacillus psychrodurans]MCK1997327.1 NAD-dependent epimerase/dehydratase family protein [Psychrobacillus psychrodurans]MCZ8541667.1 NAD-dependent epimerase/dehydratase family protein [Psychrobacillus psychrodurans]SFN09440.1 UDP-glucose 4-epimerase [Psychrobacillus psychrodurans]